MKRHFPFIFIPLLFLLGCQVTEPIDINSSVVYYNQFENEGDLSGWNGLSNVNIINEGAPFGGKNSVTISGGCSLPHASLILKNDESDKRVTISCIGRSKSLGGSVVIFSGDLYENNTEVIISDTTWRQLSSEQSIDWPAGSTLNIWMNCGGFVAGQMLIDELVIKRVR